MTVLDETGMLTRPAKMVYKIAYLSGGDAIAINWPSLSNNDRNGQLKHP